MSLHKLKNLQLQDVLIKYEALEEEMEVLKLENMEYKKDIDELQERNSILTEEIESYKEMLEIGKHQYSFSRRISKTLDTLNLNNMDLTAQIEESEQEITKSHIENMSLKNENKRYRLALERHDAVRQKREEIYMKNKLKLEYEIKELEEENDSLQLELSSMKVIILNYPQQPNNDEKQIDPEIPHSDTLRIASARTLTPATSAGSCKSMKDYGLKSSNSLDSPKTPQMFAHTPLSDINQGLFDFTNLCPYKTLRQISRKSSCDMLINQSTTNEYETDKLSAKLEEIKGLKEINDDNESLIDELQDKIKKLRQKNDNLRRQIKNKVDDEFQFCSILRWFS